MSDSVEGNIFFYFVVEHSGKNQTTINVTSSYRAEIIISTDAYNRTKSSVPIRLGTYEGIYNLYLEYDVLPIDKSGKHEVILTFIAKKS